MYVKPQRRRSSSVVSGAKRCCTCRNASLAPSRIPCALAWARRCGHMSIDDMVQIPLFLSFVLVGIQPPWLPTVSLFHAKHTYSAKEYICSAIPHKCLGAFAIQTCISLQAFPRLPSSIGYWTYSRTESVLAPGRPSAQPIPQNVYKSDNFKKILIFHRNSVLVKRFSVLTTMWSKSFPF